MSWELPDNPPPWAQAPGSSHSTSTAHKAGRAIGKAWLGSAGRAAKLAALLDHFGRQLALGIGSLSDEMVAAEETVRGAMGPTGIQRTRMIVSQVGVEKCW